MYWTRIQSKKPLRLRCYTRHSFSSYGIAPSRRCRARVENPCDWYRQCMQCLYGGIRGKSHLPFNIRNHCSIRGPDDIPDETADSPFSTITNGGTIEVNTSQSKLHSSMLRRLPLICLNHRCYSVLVKVVNLQNLSNYFSKIKYHLHHAVASHLLTSKTLQQQLAMPCQGHWRRYL